MNSDLMAKFIPLPSYREMVEFNARSQLSGFPQFNVAVLRNITIEPIEVIINYFSAKAGLNAKVEFGGFDNVLQDTLVENKVVNSCTDAIFIFVNLSLFSKSITVSFCQSSEKKLVEEKERVLQYYYSVLENIKKINKNCHVFVFLFEGAAIPNYGIADDIQMLGQNKLIASLNQQLAEMSKVFSNCNMISTDPVLRLLGVDKYYDARYWHIAKAPYSVDALIHLTHKAFKYIYAYKGVSKKCLVLDCDNTLWGGVIGEVGIEGIQLSQEFPGSFYHAFQEFLVELSARGVLLAICSKNNEEDVWSVFDQHPDMVLSREHIACSRINWNDKASNIEEISNILNIGLDAMVFLDDSSFETGLVASRLPQIDVIQVPKEKPISYKTIISSYGFFDSPVFLDEDKHRSEMYKAESKRQELKKSLTLEDYLISLEMEVHTCFASYKDASRAAQLTQKTNQFNLTTKRYSNAEINRYIDSDESDIVVLRLNDKYGDYGLVGLSVLKYSGDVAEIDTLLISCRALGREIEKLLIIELLSLCESKNVKRVKGVYSLTNKNMQVKNFYSMCGFSVVLDSEEKQESFFDLHENKIGIRPSFFKLKSEL